MKITNQINRMEMPLLTIADLCEALADGRLAAHRDDEFYTVRRQDFRRFVQTASVQDFQTSPNLLERLIAAS